MGHTPTSGCLLVTLIAIKLCVIYVVFSQSVSLVYEDSPNIQVQYSFDYKNIVFFICLVSGIAIGFDVLLLLSMFTSHFTWTKRLAIVDTLIQTSLFFLILSGLIIALINGIDDNVEPNWGKNFVNRNWSTVDNVQEKLKCCGYNGSEDWRDWFTHDNVTVYDSPSGNCSMTQNGSKQIIFPDSCCPKGKTRVPKNHFETGCLQVVKGFIRRYTVGMAIALLIISISTIPKNFWLYRYTELRRRKAREEAFLKYVQKIRLENDMINRQAGNPTFFKQTISGDSSEKENLMSSEMPQLSSMSYTSVSESKKNRQKATQTYYSTDITVNDGDQQSDRVSAGRCVLFDPDFAHNYEIEEDSSETWV